MPKYSLTSDLRISTLRERIYNVGCQIENDTLRLQDKSTQNNGATLAFYFNLRPGTNTLALAVCNRVTEVIRNFVIKFQFPNTYTSDSFKDNVDNSVFLAPLRETAKILITWALISGETTYLTHDEILYYIFCRPNLWTHANENTIAQVINEIQNGRNVSRAYDNDIARIVRWSQYQRQSRELISILTYASDAFVLKKGCLYLNMPKPNEVGFADFMAFGGQLFATSDLWCPSTNELTEEVKSDYIAYCDIPGRIVTAHQVLMPNSMNTATEIQQIFYGAPGTGKSHTINRLAAPERTVRTTFHPDSDYASFVGAYKPTMEDVPINAIVGENVKYAHPTANHPGTERKIVYKYVPQAFLRAYVAAWKDLSASHYLVIEEINRGNCAQIFGDLFQLLDRTDAGFSSYPIDADADIAQFLAHDAKGFGEVTEEQRTAILGFEIKNEAGETVLSGDDILNGTKLVLPNNLYIWATMNTSDQSLFPIDSAFKRRWNWKYVPIDYHAKEWMLEVNHKQYRWGNFLQAINPIIVQVTESPDKQMGYFFVRAVGGIVDAETFLNKVIFYLWTDVFKDFGLGHEVFQDTTTKEPLAFTDFFSVDGEPMEDRLEMFISNVSKTFQNGEVLKALGEEDEAEVDDNVASEEA